MSRMTMPILISKMLKYFDGSKSLDYALFYGFLMCFFIAVNTTIRHPYYLKIYKEGMKIRISLSCIIYKKVCQ